MSFNPAHTSDNYVTFSEAYGELFHRLMAFLVKAVSENRSPTQQSIIMEAYRLLADMSEDHQRQMQESGLMTIKYDVQGRLLANAEQLLQELRQSTPYNRYYTEVQLGSTKHPRGGYSTGMHRYGACHMAGLRNQNRRGLQIQFHSYRKYEPEETGRCKPPTLSTRYQRLRRNLHLAMAAGRYGRWYTTQRSKPHLAGTRPVVANQP